MKKILEIFNKIEEWTLVVVLLALAAFTCVQVFCRYVLNFSFPWVQELARYVGVFITFLGASLGVKYGTHFSMDLVYERVSNNRFRHGLRAVVTLICGLIFVVVAWYGWDQTMKLKHFGVLTSALELPKYWFYLPVPIFSVLISLRFFNLFRKHAASCARNEPYIPPEKKV
jgi:C4-dicarboxylate transporter DctQ subunit